MVVALFIPCYVDQFYPQVGVATLELLEKLGCTVVYPPNQTCCGQPMANSGYEHLTTDCNRLFIDNFSGFDYIVAPSGSCVLHIRDHLHADAKHGAKDLARELDPHREPAEAGSKHHTDPHSGAKADNPAEERATSIRGRIYE